MEKEISGYLIAVDLDGTLISGFDNYDEKSFELLKKLAINNYVIIATGRPLRSSIVYYNMLGLKTPIINYNGALIQNPNDQNFTKVNLSVNRDHIKQIFLDNNDVIDNIFCEVEDEIYLHKYDSKIESFLHLDGGLLHTGCFEKILPQSPNGAITFSKTDCSVRLTDYVNNNFSNSLGIRFWDSDEFIISEIYNIHTSKGYGIDLIREYYNIPFEKTISIGDGHNDIEMFQKTKYSVAMKNSHKELIEHATHTTESVSNNGVYHFLKSFFNIK